MAPPKKTSIIQKLYEVLKSELKIRTLTYRDVAEALKTSENSVRLRFSNQRLSIMDLIVISELLETSLSEIMQKLEDPPMQKFTLVQEETIASDPLLMLVTSKIFSDWSIKDIMAKYDVTFAQCTECLLKLDRLKVIRLLPNNKIHFLVKRGAQWLPNGPFYQLLMPRIADFLDSDFCDPLEGRFIARARLSTAAVEILRNDMRQLKRRMAALHDDCKLLPSNQRHNIILFMAEREWELPEIRAMLKNPALPAIPENEPMK